MVEHSIFETFARSEAIGAKPYIGDNRLALESITVARAYANHVSGLRNGRGDALKVTCGFLTDYGFNGVAGLEDDLHCCALDLNLIAATLDLAMTTMNISELMPDIGEASQEDTDRVRIRDWPMGYAYVDAPELDVRTPSERLTKPLDVTRRRCAVYLQLVMLDLLWRHEIAHALMGHVMYTRDSLNLKVLHERPDGGQSFDVLPMEVEADKHALFSCLDTAS